MRHGESGIKVLYVMGSGRSGSTISDIILGNHEALCSSGEIRNIVSNDTLGAMLCSCGQRAVECPIWSRVSSSWEDEVSDDLHEYSSLARRFERYRNLHLLVRKTGGASSSQFVRYARLTCSLMKSVRDVAGAEIVVDSSKHPLRALALSHMPGIDLYLVHLVRDGRGVAASGKGWESFNYDTGRMEESRGGKVGKLASRWLVENLVCEAVLRQCDPERSLRIRYEDLVADPEATLDRVGTLVGTDLSTVTDKIRTGSGIKTGHLISGNRLRMLPEVILRHEPDSWVDRLSEREARICWSLIGWKMKSYGYSW